MKRGLWYRMYMLSIIFLWIITGFAFSEHSERLKNFLTSNGELISRLAHPTNDYIDCYVDSDDNLVISNKCSISDSYQVLKIYLSSDFETFRVVQDDDFMPAFTATEILKDLLTDLIRDYERNSRDSSDENKFIRSVLDKIDEMDGQQLTHVILIIRWLQY